MIEDLMIYSKGVFTGTIGVEAAFNWNVRFQILCDTEEQRDYLWAMQLMYGREVDIRTWNTWYLQKRMNDVQRHYTRSMLKLELLPLYFCTSVQRHD